MPKAVSRTVVPMSTAAEIGSWYGALVRYKRAERSLINPLGALVADFLGTHGQRIAALLGGAPTLMLPTPSTRGTPPDHQPLLKVLTAARAADPSLPQVGALLEHTGVTKQRQMYQADLFRTRGALSLTGERILLLDDSWASGAAQLGAAGTLAGCGAACVLPVAIARLFNQQFWLQSAEGAAYKTAMSAPWSVEQWPHGST